MKIKIESYTEVYYDTEDKRFYAIVEYIDSDKKSTFFMELEKAIHEDMELTTEQIDSIGQIYVEWAKNKGRI